MKKRNGIFKAAMFAAVCLAQGVWAQVWKGTIDSEWYWDNTSQEEFTITKAEQLAGLAQLVNGGNNFSGKTIKLGANIVLNDTANWRKWNETKPTNIWTPIGSYTDKKNSRPFSGTFDGGGHVVSGVYISNENNFQGLFGYTDSGATIKNLGVTASYVEGNNYVSGLVGFNYGTITNCYTTGNVKGSYNVGGLVGSNNKGTITDCYATGDVSGSTVGGLVGENNDGTITDCYAIGDVNGSGSAGGLVGRNGSADWGRAKTGGTIKNCYATGDVEGSGGGLVGDNYGTITDCYATGNVRGSGGGLVGENYGTITDCYATGNIRGSGGGLVGENKGGTIANCYAMGNVGDSGGGLVGRNENGTITNCYATGDVEGSGGGLVGYNYKGTITDCYAMGNVQGRDNAGGLVKYNQGGTITNCYAMGNVNGSTAGGLVGSNDEGSTITNCYAMGNVQGSDNVGGLVGSNNKKGYGNNDNTITNCYSAGKVSGTTGNTIGGLMGTNDGTINNSYYDRQASGQSDIVKGEPKSTVQMKQQETFSDWDFDKIWKVNADKNNGYPYLQFTESRTDTVKYKYPRKVLEGKVLTDKRDNKKYKTVIIGTQTWMAENLNYNAKGSKCYDNKPANCKEYGMLYNWATAMKACPSGWHLPTNAEWYELRNYTDLYANSESGKYLKAKSGWNNNGSGTDKFGFSALPGGFGDSDGDFHNVDSGGYWWSIVEYDANNAYGRRLYYNSNEFDRVRINKSGMASIRCIQD